MSNPTAQTTQNNVPAYPPGLFTEDGGLILVAATPPLSQHGDVAAQTRSNALTAAAQLLEVNSIDDAGSPTPLAASQNLPPPLTQRNFAGNLPANGGTNGEHARVNATVSDAAQTAGVNSGEVRLPVSRLSSPLSPLEAAALANEHGSLPPSSLDLSVSHWDASRAGIEQAASSPLGLDWTRSSSPTVDLESPSPMARAAAFRSQVASNLLGLNFGDDPSRHPRAAPDRELDELDARDTRSSDDSTDYFGFFSSPPHDLDPLVYQELSHANTPRHDHEGHPLPPAPRPGDPGERSRLNQPALNGDPRASYHGEPDTIPVTVDHTRNPRKRVWLGSPDPEDLQRALRRPRPSNTTPTVANGQLPTNEECDGHNPWRSVRRRAESSTTGSPNGLGINFDPVAVSTPAHLVRTMDDLSIEAGHPPSASSRRALTSQIQRDAHLGRRDPPPHLTPRNSNVPASASSAQLSERDHAMDTDEPDNRSDSPEETPKRNNGKGKARALSSVSEYPEEQSGLPVRADDAWCEAELHKARQRSIRDALTQRAGLGTRVHSPGPSQTSGAGPSRASRYCESGRWIADERERGRRDDPSSLSYLRHNERDQEPSLPSPARADPSLRAANEEHQERAFARQPSAFVPIPNTRAAQYMAANGAGSRRAFSPPLPQRSPPSRITNRYQLYPQASISPPRDRMQTGSIYGDENARHAPTFGTPPGSLHEASPPADDERAARDRSGEYEGWPQEDGEVLPSALRESDASRPFEPTETPDGGFPTIHRDDPEAGIRGMATEWIREMWTDPPNSVVFVDVFNYRYTEDDAYNRRIADNVRRGLEFISGETDFDVVPPEPEEGARVRARDLPTLWAIRGLSPEGVARALARRTWSFPTISFHTSPRSTSIPTWLMMLEGFLNGNERNIRAAILRVLEEAEMRDWIGRMVAANPDFAGWQIERAIDAVIGTLHIQTMQLGNGNYITNIFIRSPTRDIREWRRWTAELRTRRYRSFANGTGRVRYVAVCGGCRSVSHPMHLCPFPLIRGWNGPRQGQGVFGERAPNDAPHPPGPNATRRAGRGTRPNSNTSSGRYDERYDGRERDDSSSTPRSGGRPARQTGPANRGRDRREGRDGRDGYGPRPGGGSSRGQPGRGL